MSERMELKIGAQSQAAQAIANALPEVVKPLENLGTALEAHMPGFSGGASAGFAETIQVWFEKAAEIPKGLGTYAEKLATVDKNSFDSEVATTQSMAQTAMAARLSARLG